MKRKVVLLNVPVRLWLTLSEHTDALMREYRLIMQQRGPSAGPYMSILREVAELFPTTAVPFLRGHVQSAYESGLDVLDIGFEATESEVAGMVRLHEILSEVDQYCREGVLLSLPLSDEGIALRGWVVEEANRQMRGEGQPRAWPFPVPSEPG